MLPPQQWLAQTYGTPVLCTVDRRTSAFVQSLLPPGPRSSSLEGDDPGTTSAHLTCSRRQRRNVSETHAIVSSESRSAG